MVKRIVDTCRLPRSAPHVRMVERARAESERESDSGTASDSKVGRSVPRSRCS